MRRAKRHAEGTNPSRDGRFAALLALVVLLLLGSAPCHGAAPAPGEKIVSFTADVTVRRDAILDVREEFVVHSEGPYFPWGMMRYLPIDADARWDRRFAGEWRNDSGIRVNIRELSDNGVPLRYDQGGGAYAQLQIGEPNVPLARGDHRFVLRYEAEGVLRLLADHDQLYWNAVGHYWQLPIDETTVRVRLPTGVPPEAVAVEARVGGRGVSGPRRPETELMREDSPGVIGQRATRLGPAQSLSVVLTWPKARARSRKGRDSRRPVPSAGARGGSST